YSYTYNNPITFRDPSGKIVPLVVGAVLCGTGAALGAYTYHELAGRKSSIGGYLGSALGGCGLGIVGGTGIGMAVEGIVPGIALAGEAGTFYTGLGLSGVTAAETAATTAAAEGVGGATIYETFAGWGLSTLETAGVNVGSAWQYYSAAFAAGAGPGSALVTGGIYTGSTWVAYELPQLVQNGVSYVTVWH